MNEQLLSIKFSSKTKYFSMAIICICVFASIITGPILIPFAFIIASAAFAITAFSDDGPVFLRFFTIALFISILIITKGSITTAFGGITLFLPGGLSLAWSAKKKKHFTFSISCMIISTALVSVLVGLFYIVESGKGLNFTELFEPITLSLKAVIGNIYESFSDIPYYSLLFASITKRDFIYDIYTALFRSFPASICRTLIICSFLSFAFFKHYCKKHSKGDHNPYIFMGSFSFYRASRICVLFYVVFSILFFFTDNELEIMFFTTVTDCLSLILCFEALSLMSFYMRIYNLNVVLRVVIFTIVIVLCLIPIGFEEIVSVIGFADAIWDLRRFCRRVYTY